MKFCLIFLLSVSICITVEAQTLQLVTEDGPPNNMVVANKIVGMSTEKLEAAFKLAGIPFQVALMPWSRAYVQTLSQPDHCIYSTARIEQREHLFQWVGPVTENDWVLYTTADNPAHITKIEDVRNEIIGGYSQQDAITLWLLSHGYQVDTGAANDMNPQKLMKHRFKYWADSKATGTLLLKRQGLTGKIVPALTFGHSDLYLACNLAVDARLIEKLNKALNKLRSDGTYARIEAKYLQ